mmetsp:Transcript_13803/g.41711  ORF Transcript_13803/g.41711 Transcript_13803/m.41711 type:complete len:205 (+) Transcript_13803:631-1245(+)
MATWTRACWRAWWTSTSRGRCAPTHSSCAPRGASRRPWKRHTRSCARSFAPLGGTHLRQRPPQSLQRRARLHARPVARGQGSYTRPWAAALTAVCRRSRCTTRRWTRAATARARRLWPAGSAGQAPSPRATSSCQDLFAPQTRTPTHHTPHRQRATAPSRLREHRPAHRARVRSWPHCVPHRRRLTKPPCGASSAALRSACDHV